MTLEEFSEILHYQEPDFYYHGNGYTICWARGYFPDVDLGVAPFDGTGDEFRLFHGLDDLLANGIIEGKSLREILPEIEM